MKDSRRSSSAYTKSLLSHVVKHNLVLLFFFLYLVFLVRIFTIKRTAAEGGDCLLISFLPLQSTSLGISWVIAADSSPLRIGGCRNRTWNLWHTLFRLTLSTLALVAAALREMLKTQVTLGNISRVLLNLTKRLIFVMFLFCLNVHAVKDTLKAYH